MKGIKHTALVGLLLLPGACKDTPAADSNQVLPGGMANLPGHESVAQDNTHKESPRLITAESYLRSYLRLFGGVTALQAQKDLAAGGAGVFDAWGNYLAALGLPNYAIDLPRGGQTNALMVATFERLGAAVGVATFEVYVKPFATGVWGATGIVLSLGALDVLAEEDATPLPVARFDQVTLVNTSGGAIFPGATVFSALFT